MHKKYNDSHGSIQGSMEFKALALAMPPKAKALDSNIWTPIIRQFLN
jgi:hypothetical protein